MRIPVITQEPVMVRSDVPNASYEQKRVSLSPAYNTITYSGPPNGYYWLVDAVQVEIQTDANVGTRWVYLYFMDKNGRAARQEVNTAAASTIVKTIAAPGAACGSITEGEKLNSVPLYAPVVQFPCAYGFLWTNFQGAGDVFNVHMLVREYRE